MKQKIQLFGTIIIALIVGVSLLSVFIDVFFRTLLFMMKNPVPSLLIVLGLVLAGIAIDKAYFKG
jgi:hypothetical protein